MPSAFSVLGFKSVARQKVPRSSPENSRKNEKESKPKTKSEGRFFQTTGGCLGYEDDNGDIHWHNPAIGQWSRHGMAHPAYYQYPAQSFVQPTMMFPTMAAYPTPHIMWTTGGNTPVPAMNTLPLRAPPSKKTASTARRKDHKKDVHKSGTFVMEYSWVETEDKHGRRCWRKRNSDEMRYDDPFE